MPRVADRPRPLVGITGPSRGSWLARRLAGALVSSAGGRVRMLGAGLPTALDGIDALLLGGGTDIEPARYGATPRGAGRWDPPRDEFELRALGDAVDRDLPVLGICRGAQLLNVFFGGTLYQDLGEEIEGVRASRTVLPRMRVDIVAASRLAGMLGVRRIRVNSIHHQAVRDVAPGLRVAARDAAGIPEAVEATNGVLRVGVQWHPEYMPWSRVQRRLFRRFVAAAARAA